MSRKEVPRAGLLSAALAGKITNAQDGVALHVSVRQFQRLKRRYVADGAAGLIHGLRGRPSQRRMVPALRARGAALLQEPYAGLNDCHATEKLREVEGPRLRRPRRHSAHAKVSVDAEVEDLDHVRLTAGHRDESVLARRQRLFGPQSVGATRPGF